MCLDCRTLSRIPFNKSRTRWKVLIYDSANVLHSPFHSSKTWKVGVRYKAKLSSDVSSLNDPDHGFHTLLTKNAAVEAMSQIQRDRFLTSLGKMVLVKVEVAGFNASGTWDFMAALLQSETWRSAKIVQVFTASGRHDITHRFKQ